MEENTGRLAALRAKRNLGIGIMLAGLIPMAILMVTIVLVRTPSLIMIVGTIFFFLVFFAGKTIMKANSIRSAKLTGADVIR